jgi:hypothetical protein
MEVSVYFMRHPINVCKKNMWYLWLRKLQSPSEHLGIERNLAPHAKN